MPGLHLKKQLNVRVSDEAHAILNALRDVYGEISQAALLEIVLRDVARQHNIHLPNAVTSWRMTSGFNNSPRTATKRRHR